MLRQRRRGFSMIIVVAALLMIGLLVMSAFHVVLDQRRRATLAADRALARQQAEAALAAAECELTQATQRTHAAPCGAPVDPARILALEPVTLTGFTPGQCGEGSSLGLCQPLPGQTLWALASVLEDTPNAITLPAPEGPRQPANPARYVIEPIPDTQTGQWRHAGAPASPSLFRITAAGFGVDRDVNVVLQTVYRPPIVSP